MVHICQQDWDVFVTSQLCLVHGGEKGWAVLVGSQLRLVHGCKKTGLSCWIHCCAWCKLVIRAGLSCGFTAARDVSSALFMVHGN